MDAHVALIRYLRGNLSMRPDELIQAAARRRRRGRRRPVSRRGSVKRGRRAAGGLRARTARGAGACRPTRVILVFDSDRKAIYAGKTRAETHKCPQRAALANDRLQELAAQAGMHVIDSYPVFRRHFAERLGPLDRSPVDAHWNPAAHRLMAREVARIIDR